MIQQIQILSLWVDGQNWVVQTEPGSFLYFRRADATALQGEEVQSISEGGLDSDGQLYFLASYIERMQNDAVGKTIVIDPSSDNMVRIEPTVV
jgi:hypothetical protein